MFSRIREEVPSALGKLKNAEFVSRSVDVTDKDFNMCMPHMQQYFNIA